MKFRYRKKKTGDISRPSSANPEILGLVLVSNVRCLIFDRFCLRLCLRLCLRTEDSLRIDEYLQCLLFGNLIFLWLFNGFRLDDRFRFCRIFDKFRFSDRFCLEFRFDNRFRFDSGFRYWLDDGFRSWLFDDSFLLLFLLFLLLCLLSENVCSYSALSLLLHSVICYLLRCHFCFSLFLDSVLFTPDSSTAGFGS